MSYCDWLKYLKIAGKTLKINNHPIRSQGSTIDTEVGKSIDRIFTNLKTHSNSRCTRSFIIPATQIANSQKPANSATYYL